jgi:hypothetical protein
MGCAGIGDALQGAGVDIDLFWQNEKWDSTCHVQYYICHVFYKHNIARPIFREILYTLDAVECFNKAALQGSLLCCIIPINISDFVVKLRVIQDEVSVALM